MEKNNGKSSKGKSTNQKTKEEDNNVVDLNDFKIKKKEEKILKKEERKKELIDINSSEITYDIYKENIENLTEDMKDQYSIFNDIEELSLEKDLKHYLKEYDRTTLIYICTNLNILVDHNFIPNIDFTFKKKEEYIKMIVSIIKKEKKKIVEGLKKDEIELIKDLVKYNILGINIILDSKLERTVDLLKKLGLIFTKRQSISPIDKELEFYKSQDMFLEMMKDLSEEDEEEEDFIGNLINEYQEFNDLIDEESLIMTNIHIPSTVKIAVEKYIDKCYNEKNDYYLNLINSLVNIYGAIYIEDAYKILNSITNITLEELNQILTIRILVETELFTSNYENSAIIRKNLIQDEILVEKLLKIKKEKYTLGVYMENVGAANMRELDEYTDLMNFIYDKGCLSKKYKKEDYDRIDIKVFESMVFNYIYESQVNSEKSKELIRHILEEFFDIKKTDINQIIKLIEKVADKYPKWKLGGKI